MTLSILLLLLLCVEPCLHIILWSILIRCFVIYLIYFVKGHSYDNLVSRGRRDVCTSFNLVVVNYCFFWDHLCRKVTWSNNWLLIKLDLTFCYNSLDTDRIVDIHQKIQCGIALPVRLYPTKHETLIQCCCNAGTASATASQHQNIIGSAYIWRCVSGRVVNMQMMLWLMVFRNDEVQP